MLALCHAGSCRDLCSVQRRGCGSLWRREKVSRGPRESQKERLNQKQYLVVFDIRGTGDVVCTFDDGLTEA